MSSSFEQDIKKEKIKIVSKKLNIDFIRVIILNSDIKY